ncbi:MAG: PIN domain-containing protein [Leptolyngbyaceae cyanobacterium RM2_2_4]|nr:PIN domain-containing protein [Leptolyngbyaceae cyanobacterium RM2_2_4]
MQPLWSRFYAGAVEIVSSELSLMEVLVVPMRDRNAALVSTYEQLLLSSNVRLLPISQVCLRSAAQLRASTNLKTPDAIHAATALGNLPSDRSWNRNCLFLTNDSQFRRVAGLPVVVLDDVLFS